MKMARGAFPTDTRAVAGSDAGGLRSHILAFCSKCGAEGALPISKYSGIVPADAGQKMFRAKHWRMAPHNRTKDLCPSCSGRAKIAATSEAHRAETTLQVVHDLLEAADADPRYMGQKDFQSLLREYPELNAVVHEVHHEWEDEGRSPISDTFARAEALIQAAMTRMRADPDVDPELLSEIDESLANTYAAMAESASHVINDLQAQDQREQEAINEAPMNPQPSRPATALADAFVKAQAQKIKSSGETRRASKRVKIESASLEELVKSQQRDDRRGVKEVGAKRKAPLPRSLTEPKTGVAEAIVAAVAQPEPRKKKYSGGWGELTPEQRQERITAASAARQRTLALKAGLSLEAWTARNEARKAETLSTPQPALTPPDPVPTPSKPETPVTDVNLSTGPSSVQRIAIRAALETNYVSLDVDGGGGYYVGDFSDEKLAETLGMPRAWVEQRRIAMDLGPDRNEAQDQIAGAVEGLRAELAELTADLPRLLDESLAETGEIEARLKAEFAQEITDVGSRYAQRAKDELAKAGDAHANRVAKVETRISDIEKRLGALTGKRV